MKPKLIWTDPGLPPRREDNVKATVYSMAFDPAGKHMCVAVSNLVLVYDSEDGDLVHRLRGHKDLVYTVDYARDGKRFASGGADNTVVIWTDKGEGVLKYTHGDSIQVVAHNPACDKLASCTASDFGLWSAEAKSVTKHKVYAKILSARWSNDGQYLALGLYNGHIQIRDKAGAEYKVIEKTAPVWCLAWSPARDDPGDLLAVGCWDQTISFYTLAGTPYLKERKVHFYPCALDYFPGGQYMVVGGSDKRASLCTREAVRLKNVCEIDEWVWSLAVRPRRPAVAVGSYGGAISLWGVDFETIYALDGDRFAVREHMTDVVVHHMQAEKRVRIKSRDYVRRIAIYRDRLAIQLPDRVNVYELHKKDDGGIDMHYRLRKERIAVKGEPGHLGVTSGHVLVASGEKLHLHGFAKPKEREWVLGCPITCLRVDGGPPGREGVLVGLEDGRVLKIYVDNAFPVDIAKVEGAVVKIDVTCDRKKVAVVDADGRLRVLDPRTKDVGFSAESAGSVCFNAQFDDVVCYTKKDHGELYVKTGDHSPLQHAISGDVVGFVGAKLFVAQDQKIQVIDLPQSSQLAQHVEAGEFERALRVACLGVTAADWKRLAEAAANALDLDTARAAYRKVHDLRRIELLNSMETRRAMARAESAKPALSTGKHRARPGDKKKKAIEEVPEAVQKLTPLFQAEILAYAGRYQDAARAYTKAGHVQKAIDLFADLRQWDEAKLFAASSDQVDTQDLVRRQAEWAEEVEDWKAAADMYVSCGEPLRAVRLLHEHKPDQWIEQLSLVVRQVAAKDVLRQCARAFLANGDDDRAREVYLKLDDVESLLGLYVRKQRWDEALKLAEDPAATFPDEVRAKFGAALYLPYAEWLALNDKFDEALEAYRKSGRPDRARRVMEELTYNAVVESRFKDAAYYYWLLATETLNNAARSEDAGAVARVAQEYADHLHKADLYYAYSFVEDFFLPFTPLRPEVLFQCARFLVNGLGGREAPHGVSRAKVLFTLAKQAKHLGAFKLARYAYDKLRHMQVPEAWREELDVDALTIHARPARDHPELLPVCYRCGAANALLNPSAAANAPGSRLAKHYDVCTSCGHPFVRSFLTFETLPLVEFVPEAPLTDEEALDLIREAPPDKPSSKFGRRSSEAKDGGGADVMGINQGDDDDDDDDPFNKAIQRTLADQAGVDAYQPVTVDAETLRSLNRADVFCCQPRVEGMRATYYKSAIPDVHIALSQPCHRFFHEDDYEFAVLRDGMCPYSRVKDVGDFGPC